MSNPKVKPNYKKVKETFEKTHFKIMNPISFAEVDDNKELIIRSKEDFKKAYENTYFWTTTTNEDGVEIVKQMEFLKSWFKDPLIKTYKFIDFLPNQVAPKDVYNTFTMYEANKTKKTSETEAIKKNIKDTLMYKHIENICNMDEETVDYMLKFLARKVQKPWLLTRTAFLLKGEQGTGKDTIFEWFGTKIIGSDYYYAGQFDEIFDKFNKPYLDKKILVVISETNGKETHDKEDKIKHAITRPKNKIEDKNEKSYQSTNNVGYVFLTNNTNPIKISYNDRRFCAIQCDAKNIANRVEYFKPLYNEIKNKFINRAWIDFLMEIEIDDDYDFINNRPMTSFYKDCQERNIPVLAKFLEFEVMTNQGKFLEKKYLDIYEIFSAFMKSNGYKFDYTSTKLGLELKEYKGVEKKRTNKGFEYTFTFEIIKESLIEKKYIESFDMNRIDFVEDDKMEETND